MSRETITAKSKEEFVVAMKSVDTARLDCMPTNDLGHLVFIPYEADKPMYKQSFEDLFDWIME